MSCWSDDKIYFIGLQSSYNQQRYSGGFGKEITDKEISYDDLLISSLITIAPKRITIHQYDKIKNIELLNTINNVFSGKVIMSKESIQPRK